MVHSKTPKGQRGSNSNDLITLAARVRTLDPNLSWNKCKELIANGRIIVAGVPNFDPAFRLPRETQVAISDRGIRAPKKIPDLNVIFFDSHLIVINKPSGIETVPFSTKNEIDQRQPEHQTLIETARKWLEIKEDKKIPPLRIVHRIDKGTSGLVVFARTPAAERILAAQFRAHDIKRKYLAICLGVPKNQMIENYLVDDRGDGYRGGTSAASQGKLAITTIEVLDKWSSGYAMVACSIETGRTHQIRIHLCEAGHPICGDAVYRSPGLGQPKMIDQSHAPRLALHAADLGFRHPASNRDLFYHSELPKDLRDFWQTLPKRFSNL